MRLYLRVFFYSFILFFGLLFVVAGVSVISEPVLSCTKSMNYGQYNTTNAFDFFVGNEIVAVLDPAGSNYATYANMFYPGNGIATISDTSVDQQTLYEAVCGKHFGFAYSNLAGVIGYNLSEIESHLSLPPNSLYIEAYRTIGNGGYFFNVEPKSAYVAYRIYGATSYVNDTNPGPLISYYTSSGYALYNVTYKNIYVFADPLDISRAISSFSLYGPLPSLSNPSAINASLNAGNGQVLSAVFPVMAPQFGYEIYHAQTVDNMGVGVTQWILVTP